MYELSIRTHFSAAHQLRHYRGKCEQLHGHNWDVEITLSGKDVDKTGFVIDFKDAKRIINKVVDSLDHKYLNSLKPFRKNNPTTENLARLIYEQLLPAFKRRGVKLNRVGVWESSQCGAYYLPVPHGMVATNNS